MDAVISLIQALSALLSAIAWPVIVLAIVALLKSPISGALAKLSTLTLKAGEFEGTLSLENSVQSALTAASAAKSDDLSDSPEAAIFAARSISERAVALAQQSKSDRGRRPHILWVDDQPQNNRYERAAFRALGIEIQCSTTTDDALVHLETEKFDLVISDMGRPGDIMAGYTLLEVVRGSQRPPPVIIYSGSSDPKNVSEALSRGAVGATSDPVDLTSLVVRTLFDGQKYARGHV